MKLSKLLNSVCVAVKNPTGRNTKKSRAGEAEPPSFTKADIDAWQDRHDRFMKSCKSSAEKSNVSVMAAPPELSAQVKDSPKAICSRDDQIHILAKAASEFLDAPHDESSALKAIEILRPWRFDQEFMPRAELLFGLCRTALGQHVRAIAHFDAILAKEPSDRSALVYRFIAKNRGHWNVSPQQNVAICTETRAQLICAKDDWFGRLVAAEVDHSSWSEAETLEHFREIARDHPTKALVWSMLSAEMFRQTIVFQRLDLLHEANEYAFKALQIQWLEPLSYSVVFHSGAVLHDEKWFKLAKGHWDAHPLRPPAYDVLDTDPDRISFMPLSVDDATLRSLFPSQLA